MRFRRLPPPVPTSVMADAAAHRAPSGTGWRKRLRPDCGPATPRSRAAGCERIENTFRGDGWRSGKLPVLTELRCYGFPLSLSSDVWMLGKKKEEDGVTRRKEGSSHLLGFVVSSIRPRPAASTSLVSVASVFLGLVSPTTFERRATSVEEYARERRERLQRPTR